MAQSPVIETERLKIIPFSEEYLTLRYVNWLNDPEVVRYSNQRYRHHTLDSCKAYLESFDGTPNYFWAIVARDSNLGHIGTMTAYINTVHSVADVGILIGERTVWGIGYGSEAWRAVCAYLLSNIGIRKVTAGTLSVNKAMLKLMRRTGMIEDGRRIRQCVSDGIEADMVHAAVFRENRNIP